MGKQFKRQIQAQDPGTVVVWCSFLPDTANTPVFVGSGVASVAHTSTGLWTITLKDGSYSSLLAKFATIQMASPTDVVAQLGVYVAGNNATGTPATITVTALAVATATDIAANANNSISVMLVFKSTEVPS